MKRVKVGKVINGGYAEQRLCIPKGYWFDCDYVVFERRKGVVTIRSEEEVKFELMGLDEPNEQET